LKKKRKDKRLGEGGGDGGYSSWVLFLWMRERTHRSVSVWAGTRSGEKNKNMEKENNCERGEPHRD
jgi:hypothetical protein